MYAGDDDIHDESSGSGCAKWTQARDRSLKHQWSSSGVRARAKTSAKQLYYTGERPRILSLDGSERIHFVRPSAEKLFISAAENLKSRVIAVVLSGVGYDGELGVRIIKRMGGTVIAQDEETSEQFGMPQAAINTGAVDYVLPLASIGPALVGLVNNSGSMLHGP